MYRLGETLKESEEFFSDIREEISPVGQFARGSSSDRDFSKNITTGNLNRVPRQISNTHLPPLLLTNKPANHSFGHTNFVSIQI